MVAPRTDIPPTMFVGHTLGHYLIEEKIGTGGMGQVYRARDQHLDRDVAIKVLAPGRLANPEARARFRNEALTLSKLNHPNVATIHDFDTQEGIDFIVTELVSGQSLTQRLARGPLYEKEALEFGLQLAEGLAAAHDAGVLHRDLKPGNLMTTPDGRLKILDFGLASALPTMDEDTTSEDLTSKLTSLSGTLRYISPEALRGDAPDQRSDVYSTGAVIYEMITGRPPFDQKNTSVLIDLVLNKPPLPPTRVRPEISPALEELIMRCLAKYPAERYQTARDLLADLRRAMVAKAREKSLAVLYFENLSGNREDDYFRDGITEDITTELAKIKDLKVFSRSAVLAYRDKPVTPYHVGHQLHATHVVEGSVRRDVHRIRITANLVETTSGHTLWAERFDRELRDIFAIQDEIAQNVAATLRLILTEHEKIVIRKSPTIDVRAYDFYLRGRYYFHQFRRKGLDLAREMFVKAIGIDPHYARAYAGIADCSSFLYMYWESSEKNLSQADAASQKALELDPDLAEAHGSRGLAASLKRDYQEAKRELETAMRLDPKSFEPYYFSGRNSYAQGDLAQAVDWFEQAADALPEDYQSPMLMASALHGMHRGNEASAAYRRGLAAAERHLEIHPNDARALYFGANALSQLGERERAIKWAERALEMEPEEHQVLYNVACVFALLGESERAIDCLSRSLTHGWGQREWMEHDPDLASLRGNTRFQALISKKSATPD